MLLEQRATEPENLDLPGRTLEIVREDYEQLARVNRIFRFAEPFQRLIPATLGAAQCEVMSVLDLGAGDCSMGQTLEQWARQKNWQWDVTHLDISPLALSLNESPRRVVGSALALPFRDNSFDVVIAAQMTHHLEMPDGVVSHFREAYRVARKMVIIYDLHRTLPLYLLVWGTLFCLQVPKDFRDDGLLSVKKGWRPPEWLEMARRAGMMEANVRVDRVARVVLQAVKPGTV
jgi:ubiquinone/menaquinone biosynthesis C-methylase UbiE